MGSIFKRNNVDLHSYEAGNMMHPKLGFMQGRLTPMRKGVIQEFPTQNWQQEFLLASQNDINLIEWTIDREKIYKNPLMTEQGQLKILKLKQKTNMTINSLTADCCMQVPFWKITDAETRSDEIQIFKDLLLASSKMGIKIIVLPLVDNGSIENEENKIILRSIFEEVTDLLDKNNMKIACELDLAPGDVSNLLEYFSMEQIGVNYDIGNSAALGYSIYDEWEAYGHYIMNIHIKDRKFNGPTVRLGKGAANFSILRDCYKAHKYKGNWILQTARSSSCEDMAELLLNYKFTKSHLLC